MTFWASLSKAEDREVWRLRARGLSFAEIERDICHARTRHAEGPRLYWAKKAREIIRKEAIRA